MKRPNFFIVGAAKCGTSAMYEYLQEHPQIYICNCKEPNYFSVDFPRLRRATTESEYLDFYDRANDQHIAVGDATVTYIYSEVALEKIRAFEPNAKIIVMVRNPIDQVTSMHGQTQFGLNETEPDIEKAWTLQEERAQGRHIPPNCKEPKMLQYRRVALFGQQLERLYTIFPREQVKVIVFDDFVSDPKTVYEDVLAFLGVPSDGRTEFPPVNQNKRHRSRLIGRFTQRPPKAWEKAARAAQRLLGVERIGFREAIRNFNSVKFKRPPVRPEFRAQLAEEFREDVEKLGALIGRDLSHWLLTERVAEKQ